MPSTFKDKKDRVNNLSKAKISKFDKAIMKPISFLVPLKSGPGFADPGSDDSAPDPTLEGKNPGSRSGQIKFNKL